MGKFRAVSLLYACRMNRLEIIEAILIGPNGQVLRGPQSVDKSGLREAIVINANEGPFLLKSRYERTDHTIEGVVRFDWIESARADNSMTYRLASIDGLGAHGLDNDPE